MLTRGNLTKAPIILFEVHFQNDKWMGRAMDQDVFVLNQMPKGSRFLNKFIYDDE